MAGRRDQFATFLDRTGFLNLLESIARRPQLLVINYHRIGRRYETSFDPGVFSADQETFDAQVALIKRKYALIDEMEALDIITGKSELRSTAILLTFDDGYLDNLELAVPVLKARSASAVFFLVTSYLDNPQQIPWWDRVAALVRLCEGHTLFLSEPEPWSIKIERGDVDSAIERVLYRFRSPEMKAPDVFFRELEACAGDGSSLPQERLLMGWDDARQLRDAGMGIGLHTHGHGILAKLDAATQRHDLQTCRDVMRSKLGIDATMLAYPVGTREAFNQDTKRIAKDVGFQAAFSFYGGSNAAGSIDPYDVRRVSFPEDALPSRSRAAIAIMAATGSVWA